MRLLNVVPVLSCRFGGPAMHVVESSLSGRAHGVESSIVSTNLAGAPSRKPEFIAKMTELPEGANSLDITLCASSWPYRLAYSRELNQVLHAEIKHFDLLRIHLSFVSAVRRVSACRSM